MSITEKIKKQGTASILVISIFLGLIAGGLSVLYLKNREAALRLKYQQKPEPMTTVVVPRRDLFPGEEISARTVAALNIPTKYVDKNVLHAGNYKKVQGRRLQYAASSGKPIPLTSLMGVNSKDFSDNVNIGKRGITIKVDTVNSFDGMLRPGNTIDLLIGMPADQAKVPLTPNLESAGSEEVIFPLLENIQVLATGNDTVSTASRSYGGNVTDADFSTITIDLYPEQAAMLKSAEEVGRIIATLRNRDDKSESGYEFVKPSQLLDLMKKARNAARARASTEIVTDANGNVLGKVVGDTVYDAQGNVIGKVDANGNVVDADGKTIGKKQQAQIALGADGKPIGTIVGDKVYDENGNIIGRVDKNGRVIAPNGQVIGSASTGVAVDANGNKLGNIVDGVVYDQNGNVVGRVDANGNVVSEDGTVLGSTVSKVAVGADGKPLGKIVGDKVYDDEGNLIGRVDKDGNVLDLNGKSIGRVADNVTAADVALDKNGNVIGRIDKDGNVIDKFGNVVGKVNADGQVVDNDGNVIGTKVENVLLDASGNVAVTSADVALDKNGNVIGRIDANGNVIDKNGNVVGKVNKDGQIVDNSGKVIGVKADGVLLDSSGNVIANELVDENGNVIGKVIGNQVYDDKGNVIGTVDENGNVVDLNGKPMNASVRAGSIVSNINSPALDSAGLGFDSPSGASKIYDSMVGGKAEDGTLTIQKQSIE